MLLSLTAVPYPAPVSLLLGLWCLSSTAGPWTLPLPKAPPHPAQQASPSRLPARQQGMGRPVGSVAGSRGSLGACTACQPPRPAAAAAPAGCHPSALGEPNTHPFCPSLSADMEPAAVIAPNAPSTATINDLPDDLLGRVLALAGRSERCARASLPACCLLAPFATLAETSHSACLAGHQ